MLVELSLKQISWDSGVLVLTDLITEKPQPQGELGLERNSREQREPRLLLPWGHAESFHQSSLGLKSFLLNLPLGSFDLEATYSQKFLLFL